MGKDKLPRIPSLSELGISDDEVADLEREIAAEAAGRDGPEAGGEGATQPGADKRPSRPTAPSGARVGKVGGAGPGGGPAKGRDREHAGADSASEAAHRKATRKASRAGASPAANSAPDPAPAPWAGLRGLATLVILLGVGWFSSSYRSMPPPVASTAPETAFSSARAMTHLLRLASEARPPGSPAHQRALDYLVGEFQRMGHEPVVQTTTSFRASSDFTRAATVRNVIVRIPGSEPGGRAVLVAAHYDSRGISVGAADDGAGVVAILEAVRALGRRAELRNDVIVLLTDGEELGLLGARAFVDEHPWMGDVALVLNFEMRGGGGPSTMFETGENNGWVIDALREADPYPAANSASYEIYKRMPNDTDFTPFREAGRQGLNFAGIGRAHVYHQVYDTPGSLSEATLQHHGEHALAMLEHFGNADLAQVNAPNKAYVALPLLGLVAYGQPWIWLLGLATIGAWALAFVVARRRGGARVLGVLGGMAGAMALAAVAALGAERFVQWRIAAHPEAGALHAGIFHSEGWYLMAVVCGTLALAVVVSGALRRWITAGELGLGALLVPVGLAAAVTVAAPLAALNVQWPAIAGCLATLAVAGLGQGRRMGFGRWFAVLLGAAAVMAVLVPLVEGVGAAMGLGRARALTLLVALALTMMFPVLDVLREPNAWWAPVGAAMAGGAFLAVGMTMARPSADRPAPSTLVYALDRETGTAFWGTDPAQDASDPGAIWAEAAVGPFGVALVDGLGGDGLEGDAQQGDADRARTGAWLARDSLRAFTVGGAGYAVAIANVADVAAPVVEVVEAEAGGEASPGSTNLIRVAVRSAIGAETMILRFDDPDVRPVAVNGRPLPPGAPTAVVEHWGAPEGAAVLLDFPRGPDGAPPDDGLLRFTVVEHHLRPGELVGPQRFARPPELAPNIRTLSDRALIRTPVEVEAGR